MTKAPITSEKRQDTTQRRHKNRWQNDCDGQLVNGYPTFPLTTKDVYLKGRIILLIETEYQQTIYTGRS